jgi:predicted NUDIX family NTP pyrophosphohydrolase
MKQSSGILFYRDGPDGLEVLLVHPSGNYNRHAPWGIPKGEPDEGEDLETTARRETREEAGVEAGSLVHLGFIQYQKSRKQVHCFAGPAPADANPHPASWEVDQVCFMSLTKARERIHTEQAPFLDRLLGYLAQQHRDKAE